MKMVKRTYIYIASFISLNAVAWAIIFLFRNLIGEFIPELLAWQLSIIVFGFPFYIGHWAWIQQINKTDKQERTSEVRAFYFYAMLASLLGPAVNQLFQLIVESLELLANVSDYDTNPINHLIAFIFLAVLWLYHMRIVQNEYIDQSRKPWSRRIRQLYQWGFSITGLVILSYGIIELLNSLIAEFFLDSLTADLNDMLHAVVRVVIGGGLWIAFWQQLQANFAQNKLGEQGSILRKIFLYAIMFISLANFIYWSAVVWDRLLRNLFKVYDSLPSLPDWDQIISMMAVSLIVWVYHLLVLQRDVAQTKLASFQQTIQHVYQYLTAGIALIALAGGLSGMLHVLLENIIDNQSLARDMFLTFLATVFAAAPVWLWQWGMIQQRSFGSEKARSAESHSLVRRIYLYILMTIAGLVVLSAGVYLVYDLFQQLFGVQAYQDFNDTQWAQAYGVVFLIVWLYHFMLARRDGQRQGVERQRRVSAVTIAIFDSNIAGLTESLQKAILARMPKAQLKVVPRQTREGLGDFDIAVGPWRALANFNQASVHKIMLPIGGKGNIWAGVSQTNARQIIDDAAQKIEGLTLKQSEPMFKRSAFGWILGVVLILILFIAISRFFFWF